MVTMAISDPETPGSTPPEKPLTVEDLARMPDDGQIYELADGRLDVTPAPASPHTRAETRLSWQLINSAPEDVEIQTGPGVTLNDQRTSHRIPDVAVFRAGALERPYFTTPPLLAVEVVSPESVLRDHHRKKREYAAFGVESYWIVDPSLEKPGIIELRLSDGEYTEVTQVLGDDVFATKQPFPVRIVPTWLVADGPWRRHIGGEADTPGR
ncbi:Uma2 family endonuclease [Lipingzhangella sp. LS1_29]|uniref:Uma2 family endonuclease n=2 Tax=Lipingzhangella rawalii TaxID=2055835 RepID=A0ABU2H4Z1_9ACTN|nr:Uma2 family endonuclease [Lipingzhangella rawalii]MDS1269885.1 Uma2 family endonuclease [Lipingzhangella rawalii]